MPEPTTIEQRGVEVAKARLLPKEKVSGEAAEIKSAVDRARNTGEEEVKIAEELRQSKRPVPSETTQQNIVEQNFKGDEHGWEGEVRHAGDLAREFDAKGYDGLSDQEKKDEVYGQVAAALSEIPSIRAVLDELAGGTVSPEARQAAYDRVSEAFVGLRLGSFEIGARVRSPQDREVQDAIRQLSGEERKVIEEMVLRNPKFKEKLAGIFDGNFRQENLISNQEVNQAQAEFNAIRDRKANIDERVRQITETEFPAAGSALKAFNENATITRNDGTNITQAARLEELRPNIDRFRAQFESNKTQIDQLRQDIRPLLPRQSIRSNEHGVVTETESEVVKNQIGEIQKQIDALETTNKKLNNDILEFGRLDQHQRALNDRVASLKQERDQKNAESIDVDGQYTMAEDKLKHAESVRNLAREQFKNKVKVMFADAAKEFMADGLNEYVQAEGELRRQEKQEELNADQKRLIDNSRARYVDMDRFEQRKKVGLLEEKKFKSFLKENDIDADMDRLIRENSADGIAIETLLMGVDDPAEQQRLRDRFKNDQDFANEARNKVTTTLFRMYMAAGGKITEAQSELIRDTEWGRGMISQALQDRKAAARELSTLLGQDVLSKDFMTRVRSMGGRSVLSLLLLLIGGAAISAASLGVAPIALGAAGIASVGASGGVAVGESV